jgi:hypothetical protein
MIDKERSHTFFIINILLVILVSAVETSFWYWLFAPVPSPMFWLSIVVATMLYRGKFEGLLIIYIPSLFFFSLTAEPLGFLLFGLTTVYIFIKLLKDRIFIPSKAYFAAVYAASILIFQISIFLISILTEVKPHSSMQIWKWLSQALLGLALSPIYYPILEKLNPPDESIREGGTM